jgi:hypothetical protein
MVPAFLDLGGNFRRYGRQLREYLEDVFGMCHCRGACFFNVGGTISWLREAIKTICREYWGNVPAAWCLLCGFGWEMFVGTGDNKENILRMYGECASVVAPVFYVGGNISWLRETLTRICREYGGNAPASWCLLFGCGWEMVVGAGDNYLFMDVMDCRSEVR